MDGILLWKVTGMGLPPIAVYANTIFDALMRAQETDERYSTVYFIASISDEGFLEHYRG